MNELTAADIDRLCREMVARFRAMTATDEADAAAAMGLIMAEYPPAVAWSYLLMCQHQMITGRTVIHGVPRGRRP